MSEKNSSNSGEDEGASNLRAIFEILSYILVDAQQDNQSELADRIEFALNLAEKLIKEKSTAPTHPADLEAKPGTTAAPSEPEKAAIIT